VVIQSSKDGQCVVVVCWTDMTQAIGSHFKTVSGIIVVLLTVAVDKRFCNGFR
jgi:hypothetical protein